MHRYACEVRRRKRRDVARRRSRLERTCALVSFAVPALAASPIAEVPSGTVLGKDNWQIAQGLLPDEILEFYKRGEYANPIIKLEAVNRSVVDPVMRAASEKNRGRFTIDEHGTVVDKETGKRPPIITGMPFPDIDTSDPQAGAKVIWN
jgi:hypothetical protein